MPPTYERRSGKDRRQREIGWLGKIERRRRVEARKPELVDVVLSETEWELHFGNRSVRARKYLLTRRGSMAASRFVTREQKTRSGADRRQEDLGPPGKREQRTRAESRKPEILEIDLTHSEWANHFGILFDTERESE
jgi:hypothetical protein